MEFIRERSLFFCNDSLAGHFTDSFIIYLLYQGELAKALINWWVSGAASERNVIETKPGLYVLGTQMEYLHF